MTCPHCGRVPDQWHKPLALATGAPSCNFSADWQAECHERHKRVLRCLRLDDREDRRCFIANIERSAAESAPPGVDPAVYAAEVRRRLEAAVLDHWQRARAAQAA